ncbi:MAG TPA: hypothetical protein VMG59_06685 [Phycisphaerae bacterium]|nr:hypothetical protein [Phycisphaerae bacterium]
MEPLEPRLLLSVLAGALPAGYVDANIGNPQVSGAAEYTLSNNQWSVSGVGKGISSSADQFNFAYENWTGAGVLVANVGAVGNTGSGAQAGLMIRDSSSSGAIFAAVLVNANNQVTFEYRTSTGGKMSTVTGGTVSGPIWLELVETQKNGGEQFTAYYSSNDVNWTAINTTPINITFKNSTNLAGLAVTSSSATQTDSVNFSGFSTNTAPIVTAPAAASSSTVTDTTANLSVSGEDTDGQSAGTLTYTWSVTSQPSGAATPTFSANGTNAASNTIVTFSQAGKYTFLATITDSDGVSATSSVSVTVNQTLTSINLSPSTPSVGWDSTTKLSAVAYDQFGNKMANQPTFSWSVTGCGSIKSSGKYTAPATDSTATIKAAKGSISGSDEITVTNTPPTDAPAAASPSTVTGTTTKLSVSGKDTDGQSDSTLIYTWSVTSQPSGSTTPTFSANGTDAAKNTTATFFQAGIYTFLATITDSEGESTTSSVNVTVEQTLKSISVSPSIPSAGYDSIIQFSATALDQFGDALATQPTFKWSVSRGGSINSSGVYTAPTSAGTVTIKATSGSVSGSDSTTIVQTQTEQTEQSSAQLPSFTYSAPSSAPSLPSGIDPFSPPVGGTTNSGAPIIDASDTIASPNDSITLTGAQFTSYTGSAAYSDTQFLVYGQTSSTNGALTNAQIQDTSADGVIVTIGSTEPANSMYLIWAQNSSGVSTPIAINDTQAWWVSNAGNASPGQTISVYGKNLSNGASTPQSWVYLQPTTGGQGQWATVTAVNPYQVNFVVPTSLTNGTYQVWVNNGLGGNYSWSQASTLLTVQGAKTWNSALTVNVQNYGAIGNDTTDDGDAILAAIAALQPGDTLYFPNGTYIVNNADLQGGEYDNNMFILPSDVRVEGASEGQTIIEFQGSVPKWWGANFEIGAPGQSNVEFDSLTLEYAGPETYPVDGTPALVYETGGTNFTFDNVTLLANDLTPIDWEDSSQLTLENSTILGQSTLLLGANNVSINNNSFYEGYYAEEAIDVWGGYNISITNNQIENAYQYTGNDDNQISESNSSGWGQGRFLENNLAWGPIYNEYIANNTTYLGTLLSLTPNGQGQNTGEQILYEGPTVDSAYGAPSSITTNTVTFASSTFNPDNNTSYAAASAFKVGMNVIVTNGAGVGQMRTVTNVAFTYNKQGAITSAILTLNSPWTVTPNLTSKIDVYSTAYNDVIYNNNLQDQTGPNGATADEAAAGVEVFEGAYGLIIDSNTISNLNNGINLWSAGVENPVYFVETINNNIENTQYYGIGLSPTPTQNLGNSTFQTDTDPNFIGVTLRNNNISGTPEGIALVLPEPTWAANSIGPQYATGTATLSIVEFNTISPIVAFPGSGAYSYNNAFNKASGIAIFTDPNVLIYENTINGGTSGNTSPAVWFGDSTATALLQNNTYLNYSASQIYSGAIPGGMLELPQEVYSQTLASGTTVQTSIVLQNDGAASLNWTGSTNASWLTFLSPSGSVLNESSSVASLVFNTNGLSAGTYSAIVTITNGLEIKKLTVVLTVN